MFLVFFGDFLAHTAEILSDLPSTEQGCVYVRQDVLTPEMVHEGRLLQEFRGLIACAAQQEGSPRCP